VEVALLGAHRTYNFGDLLLAHIYARWVRETVPHAQLSLPYASKDIAASLGYSEPEFARGLLRADKVLFIGGGYFGEKQNPTWRDQLVRFHRYMYPGLTALAANKDVGVIGVGFGPLSSSLLRRSARFILNHAQIVALRDKESREYAQEYGVKHGHIRVTADAALALKWSDLGSVSVSTAEALLQRTPPDARIGVHLSNLSDSSAAYDAVLHDIQLHIQEHPRHHAYLLCDQRGSVGQQKMQNRLQSTLGHRATSLGYQDPEILSAVLGRLCVVVTDKLHVGMVARVLGTPSVSVANHQKTARLYKQLDASADCVAIDQVESGFVHSALQRLMMSGRYEVPPAVVELANENKRLVRDFLVGPTL